MNTQEQTTPEPWRYVENRNTPRVESEATGQRICNFFGAGGLYASYRANSRLIVASPQLLRALEDVAAQRGDWLGAADFAIAQAREVPTHA